MPSTPAVGQAVGRTVERTIEWPAPPSRALVQRARPRAAALPDRVEFAAGCPGCGEVRQWTQTRDDTRLVSVVHCPCPVDG